VAFSWLAKPKLTSDAFIEPSSDRKYVLQQKDHSNEIVPSLIMCRNVKKFPKIIHLLVCKISIIKVYNKSTSFQCYNLILSKCILHTKKLFSELP